MSTPPSSRKPSPTEQARREVEAEREQLVQAVDQLRAEITDMKARLRRKLPFFAAGALAAGFFVAGGAGATARLLAQAQPRRQREGALRPLPPCRPRLATARQSDTSLPVRTG